MKLLDDTTPVFVLVLNAIYINGAIWRFNYNYLFVHGEAGAQKKTRKVDCNVYFCISLPWHCILNKNREGVDWQWPG